MRLCSNFHLHSIWTRHCCGSLRTRTSPPRRNIHRNPPRDHPLLARSFSADEAFSIVYGAVLG